MRGRIFLCGLFLALSGALAPRAQGQQVHAAQTGSIITGDLYCSGIVTTDAIPRDTFLISGEQSTYKITFEEGDYVYINKGSSKGVRVGDRFLVQRVVTDYNRVDFYKWQSSLLRAMGTVWEDEGRLTVVVAQADVSIAQVSQACGPIQRGDVVLPFAERPAPALKSDTNFDRFAPPSGKSKAMLVIGKTFQAAVGMHDIAYINLGNAQGVHVGDYVRVFRYQGADRDGAYQTGGIATHIEGFGAAPGSYNWNDMPREIIGEGIVVRTAPNASTVLITFTLRDAYAGDYIEIE